MVVQIAQGRQRVFLGCTHLGQQLFCGGLAITAGDADNLG